MKKESTDVDALNISRIDLDVNKSANAAGLEVNGPNAIRDKYVCPTMTHTMDQNLIPLIEAKPSVLGPT